MNGREQSGMILLLGLYLRQVDGGRDRVGGGGTGSGVGGRFF